jgi:hypothetical protein
MPLTPSASRAICDHFRQFDSWIGNRIDTVGNDSKRGVLDGIDNVVERAYQRLDVLRIKRGDEGCAKALERLMSYLIAAALEGFDPLGDVADAAITSFQACQQEARNLAQDFGLLVEILEEMFVFW